MRKRSGLRHSPDVAGIEKLSPTADPDLKCTAKDCPYMGTWVNVAWLRYGQFLCWYHRSEMERLIRSQGKDWGRDRHDVGSQRFFYAKKRGYHSY